MVAVDPTRRRTGGALLGDRIRMNSLRHAQSLHALDGDAPPAPRDQRVLADAVAFLRAAGFDLVLVETAGIGQSDSEIVDLVDLPVYVMTSEFGAASQLEKIDMLDLADIVVINKFDKRGAEDALRDVRKQWRRNHVAFATPPTTRCPVYPTIASQFNDPGVNWMFVSLCAALAGTPGAEATAVGPRARLGSTRTSRPATRLIPGQRVRYLAEIAEQGRGDQRRVERARRRRRRRAALYESLSALGDPLLPEPL